MHGQQRDDAAFVEKMRGAILAAPKKPGRDASGYLEDAYWERSIRGAFERIAAGPEVINAPPVAAPGMTADEAAASLVAPTRRFFHDAAPIADARMEAHLRQHEPILGGIGERVAPSGEQAMALAGIGIGKTHAALTEIASYIRESSPLRAKPRRVIYIAPDHNLARDVAGRFRKEFPDVPVHVHLGIEQPDPNAGDAPDAPEEDRTRMCRRWEDAKAVLTAGGEIGALCGSQKRGYCPFHPKSPEAQAGGPVCGRLSTPKPEGGLVILAGPQALTQAPPSALRRTAKVTKPDGKKEPVQLDPADVLVIDEPKFLAMLGGLGAKPYDVSPAKLSAKLTRFGGLTQPDDEVNASDTQDAFRALADVTEELPAAPLNGADIRRLVQLRDWARVSRSVWWFKADPQDYIEPGWSGSQLHETLARIGKHNRGVTRRARVCKVIQAAAEAMEGHPDEALSGLIKLVNEDGEPAMRLRWREPIAPAWSGIPTLLLDATGEPEIARNWLPDLKVIADAKAATPACVTRRQVWGSSFPYLSWVPSFPEQPATKESPDLERTCWNNAQRMMRLLTVMAARYQGQGRDGIDVLAIVPDRLETALRTLWGRLGGVPEGLALEHFNNIRGVDRYGGVRCLITVSRPLPSTYDLEATAWTLTGVCGQAVADGKLPRSETAYILRDGTARRSNAVRHPDPMAERVRQQLCDAEVLQAEGRGRAVRRTEQNPLDVLILTDTPLGVAIDELVTEDAVMADASFPAWLVASGVVPDMSGKGHWDFLGAVMGKSPDAVREQFRLKKDWGDTLESFLKCQKSHKNNTLMGNLALERYKVRITKEMRYASSVWITAADENAARARLLAVGVEPAEVRLAPKAEPKAEQPAPSPLPPIIAGVNATLAMPSIVAFATVSAPPPPDNDRVDIPPFDNVLSLEQVAAVQDLCAYWASDDLCFIGTQPMPPVEHRQPRPAAPAKPYPARAIPGGYGALLEPGKVFAGSRDMAVVEASWHVSGRGIRKLERWRAASLPASSEAQASAL